jgi:hypothetical protein
LLGVFLARSARDPKASSARHQALGSRVALFHDEHRRAPMAMVAGFRPIDRDRQRKAENKSNLVCLSRRQRSRQHRQTV